MGSFGIQLSPPAFADGFGGYAVVHPDGHVCGVIVSNSSDPFGNGGIMAQEYMGCPSGSKLVFQTKPSPSGNVAGWHGLDVIYRNGIFTVWNGTTISNGIATDPDGRVWDTGSGATITPGVTPTPTASATPAPSETSTATSTPTPTPTETRTATATASPTSTPSSGSLWNPPADSYELLSDYDNSYTRICLTLGWVKCGIWTIYNANGLQLNRVIGPYPLSNLVALGCQNSNVNLCGMDPKGYAVLNGIYSASPSSSPSATPSPSSSPSSSPSATPSPSSSPSSSQSATSSPSSSPSANGQTVCTGGSGRTPGLPQCLMPENFPGSTWNEVSNSSGVVINGAVCSPGVCGRNGEWRTWPSNKLLNDRYFTNGYPENSTYIQSPTSGASWGKYYTNGVYETSGGQIYQPGSSTPMSATNPTATPTATPTHSETSTATSEPSETSTATTEPKVDLVTINGIASLKAAARIVAQLAANSTPGIQRCSNWKGFGQSGQECAFTYLGLGEKPLVSDDSDTPTQPTSETTTATSQSSQNSDSSTATSATNSSGLVAVSVEGTSKQIATLIPKLVQTVAEQASLVKILTKLDALRPLTYSKTQALPNERSIEETAVSLTPDICSVKGTKVTSLKPGKCVFSYELVGASGNSFTVEKEIVFKK